MLALLRDRPLESLLCPNSECRSNHGYRQGGLKVRYWRGDGTIRYLHCCDCGAEFSERQGTPLFNLRVTEQKAFDVLNHLREGCGIRGTSRLCTVQEETVIRLQRRCGDHFKRWHDSRVQGVHVHEAQFDEKWSFVGKKQKNCDPDDPRDAEFGDQWDHVALAAESRLVVSMVPGKRTADNTSLLVADFAGRTGEEPPPLVTSDEYAPYATALAKQYSNIVTPQRTGTPGRPRQPYNVPMPELTYATVHKTRKKGRVVAVTQTLVYGTQERLEAALASSTASTTINTSFVERYNGTDRHFNSRKTRSTYAFSKERQLHEAASWLGVTAYNFCRPHAGLAVRTADGSIMQRTPAMAAGLSQKPLSLTDILHTQLF